MICGITLDDDDDAETEQKQNPSTNGRKKQTND